jgi:hypothetical protein
MQVEKVNHWKMQVYHKIVSYLVVIMMSLMQEENVQLVMGVM